MSESELKVCVACEVMMECEGRLCPKHRDFWFKVQGMYGL
jgi:RNA polymerase subunit RPABC4/transcription elongation factor Spt4